MEQKGNIWGELDDGIAFQGLDLVDTQNRGVRQRTHEITKEDLLDGVHPQIHSVPKFSRHVSSVCTAELLMDSMQCTQMLFGKFVGSAEVVARTARRLRFRFQVELEVGLRGSFDQKVNFFLG